MALRQQPYFPLYVQDYLTDEKLNLCSASAQGVYIKLLCIFHKSETYGGFLIKQKDKQTSNQIQNFAYKFAKLLSFDFETIEKALVELVEEDVLQLDTDFLSQKRMVRDFDISTKRSQAGKKGGGNPNLFKQKNKQIDKQNPEYEIEIENAIESDIVISKKNEWQNLSQKQWIKENCPSLLQMNKPITEEGLNKLVAEFGMTKVEEKLTSMENMPNLRKKYKDAYITARNWCKMDKTKDTRSTEEKFRDVAISNELKPLRLFNPYTGKYELTNDKQ